MSDFDRNIALAKFKSFLAEKGLKLTAERLIILEESLATEGHFEADDLLMILKNKGRKTSRATVYRTLDIIALAGILRKVYLGDAPVQFEKITDEPQHDHMICQKCGAKIEFHLPELSELQEQLCDEHDFTMKAYSLQIYGICSNCSENKSV
ncbi:MAG: transcriptional repressor [candidate division Zixibacteria bacterium]|nr:transcriptional repressor [candidate division Zixibacteria bacterium]